MDIFGKRSRGMGSRKALFLCTTILRGFRAKDENEGAGGGSGDDGIEVGPGFAQAAENLASDDNRAPEQRGRGATQDLDTQGNDADESGENSDNADGGAAPDDEAEPKPKPKKKRETAPYIRDIKRENRELRQRLEALENRGLPQQQPNDNNRATSEAPDPSDATKYPLGVLDDGYISDKIDFEVEQRLANARAQERASEQQATRERQEQARLSTLRGQMEDLTDKGSELFDDFEETVVESGLRGDWNLTETTFTACAEAGNGASILHALSQDADEAERVSQLSPVQQIKYVLEKDAELEKAKPKPRTKPGATPPPKETPRGRNASAPIRADTDNLDDFRKLFYQK